ncbi:hypothetical protein [Lactobacillus amylovorus]|uniref:hypothetical protein n=1 Tax=Lactobacillus amylovorus TaxID=1604 RepID=UPI0021A3FF04|nr:hypothetical protein [Lactobacillus amylovorus]MCT3601276.1 hypothetical protein [Lactobacillus amylovorus]
MQKLDVTKYLWDNEALGIKAIYEANIIDRSYPPHIANSVAEITDSEIVWAVQIQLRTRYDSYEPKINLPYLKTSRTNPDLEAVLFEYKSLVRDTSELMQAIIDVFDYLDVHNIIK